MNKFAALLLVLSAVTLLGESAQYEWIFSEGLQGWQPRNWESLEVTSSGLVGVTQKDAQLISPPLDIDAAEFDTVILSIKSNKSESGEIFFDPDGTGFKGEYWRNLNLNGNNKIQTVKISMKDGANWKGRIKRLRIDPLNSEGAEITVISVAVVNAKKQNLAVNGKFEVAEGGEALNWTFDNGAELQLEGGCAGPKCVKLAAPGASALYSSYDLSLLGRVRTAIHHRGGAIDAAVLFTDELGEVYAERHFDIPASSDWQKVTFDWLSDDLAFDALFRFKAVEDAAWIDGFELIQLEQGTAVRVYPRTANWEGAWIWSAKNVNDDACGAWLRKRFVMPEKPWVMAKMQFTCDDACEVFVNGQLAGSSNSWRHPVTADIAEYLVPGENEFLVKVTDDSSNQGFIAEFYAANAAGEQVQVLTGKDWEASVEKEGPWEPAFIVGYPPCLPWGKLPKELVGINNPELQKLDWSVSADEVVRGTIITVKFDDIVCPERDIIDVRCSFLQNGEKIYEQWATDGVVFTDGKASIDPIEFFIPMNAEPGPATLKIELVGVRQPVLEKTITILDVPPAASEYPVAKVTRMPNGIPGITVNGEAVDPTQVWVPEKWAGGKIEANQLRNIRESGIPCVNIVLPLFRLALQRDGSLDFSAVDNMIGFVLSQSPDACIMISVNVNLREANWWLKQNPAEQCRLENGSNLIGVYGSAGAYEIVPSFGSQLWRRTTNDAMRKLVQHLRETPFAGRIIGFQPTGGISEEWFNFGSQQKNYTDYSEVSQADFRLWLKKKYGADAMLQAAWKRSDVTLDTATIPSVAERKESKLGIFYDPQTQRNVLDFHDYQHDLVIEVVLNLAKTIKEETRGNSIVGTFYGYTRYIAGNPFFCQASGHSRLGDFLASPYMDYHMAPDNYCWRGVGDASGTMTVPWSSSVNGKIFFNQDDQRTPWSTQDGEAWGPADARSVLSVMRREQMRSLAEGNVIQWFDFSRGWTLGDKRYTREVKRLTDISKQYRATVKDWPQEDYLLVVVDETQMGHADPMRQPYGNTLILGQTREVTLSGVPNRWVLMSDLAKFPELLESKAVLFLNLLYIDDARAELLKRVLEDEDRVVGFVGSVGIVDDQGLNNRRLTELTGFAAAIDNAPRELMGFYNGKSYGTSSAYEPTLLPEAGENDRVWATYADGTPAALARGRFYWSAVPCLLAAQIREMADAAGILVVSRSDDPLFAGCGFVGIHAATNGTKTLKFPRGGNIRELFSGKSYGNGDSVTIEMETGDNALFIAE